MHWAYLTPEALTSELNFCLFSDFLFLFFQKDAIGLDQQSPKRFILQFGFPNRFLNMALFSRYIRATAIPFYKN